MNKHLVIPDTQVKPGVPTDHLEWAGRYIVDKKPDTVVMLGDFADMSSLNSYDKGKKDFEGRRYQKDIDATKAAMERLVGPIRKARGYKPRMVLTLGNHEERILRAVEAEPILEGKLSYADLGYEDFGWEVHEYLEPVTINGVTYCHYLPSGPNNRPITTARMLIQKFHQSCFCGHQQGRDIAYARRADGRTITAIICGSFYLHKEKYLGPVAGNHWNGIYVLHEVNDGAFDEMAVSIGYLKRKYG